jgi:hypothetical protein
MSFRRICSALLCTYNEWVACKTSSCDRFFTNVAGSACTSNAQGLAWPGIQTALEAARAQTPPPLGAPTITPIIDTATSTACTHLTRPGPVSCSSLLVLRSDSGRNACNDDISHRLNICQNVYDFANGCHGSGG